jgi:2-(1,2-epoxy-1,2-dihydrophenyl)acetyl-CoA isomerase
MMREGTEGLRVETRDGVVMVHLDRSEKRNALTYDMVDALIEVVARAPQERDARVLLLSHAGADFCAGFDLVAGNARPEGRTGELQRRLPVSSHRLVQAMTEAQLPIVCSMRGLAAGLGLHLALACDFVVASRTAQFWEPYVLRGLGVDAGGTYLLPRLVGLARARRMLLLGQRVTADDAAAWGLIHDVVEDEQLEAATGQLVGQLAGAATVAVGLVKWCTNRNLDADLTQALANEALSQEVCLRSRDFEEGIAAFRERRPPVFEGN